MQSNKMEFWCESQRKEIKIYLFEPPFQISISVDQETRMVKFQEGFDDHYQIVFSKQDAIKALQEAIKWIEQNA